MVNILADYQRQKEDNNNDSLFYSNPRIVHHLDKGFRSRLTTLYRERINNESIILDLMSSWDSHLPANIKYKKVIGHGLNMKELESNKRLDSFWVQDLNNSQVLPLDDCSIDVCLIVASWQYLQYPESLSLEINRVVRPKGNIIVSFSNRAFWSKATRVWINSTDTQRLDYISNVLQLNGWIYIEKICDYFEGKDLLTLLGLKNDPFFSVIAQKNDQ